MNRFIKMPAALILSYVFSACVFAQNANPDTIGPYVQNVTATSAVICWATQISQAKITGADGKEWSIPQYQQHELLLPGLKPNTTYNYDVFGNDNPAGKGSFATFPAGMFPYRFVVFGDTRSRHEVHARIVAQIMAAKPLFAINSGDLVSNGQRIRDWQEFFRINHDLMKSISYFPVLGNHERDSQYYFDFFHLPGNERYYQFSVGDALFIMLDTAGKDFSIPDYVPKENRMEFYKNQLQSYYDQQKTWLEHILSLHKDAGFVFVTFHHPLISIKASRLEEAKLRRAFWGDIFERHNVQVVFSGHDHYYHHALNNGTHYVTTGGGGAPLYDTDAPQPETVKYSKIEHIILVDLGEEEAKIAAVDINGNVIDEFVVSKRAVGSLR